MLHLDYVGFHEDDGTGIGIFSKCANLENLTLINFKILESRNPTLSHPKLANLTLKNRHWTAQRLNVVAPQLKSLTIRRCYGKHVIDAPNLASLLFHSECRLRFSTDLPSLEKVDLCICSRDIWGPYRIACLLHQLLNVKFLKLNLEFLEPLISCLGEISPQPSLFSNLKSLKVYPVYVTLDDKPHEKIILSTQVINFLLDGSPGATFTLISYEEIKEKMQKARASANAAAAQKLMTDLQVLLEKEKDNIETNMNHPVEADAHDQGKSPVEKVQLQFERKMEQMKSYWEDVGVQSDRGGSRTCYIISRLHDIEVLLLKNLPTSKRDELQACFSRLCAEVDSVVMKILHRMKIQQIHLNDCFNEPAITSISPS
ncbi:uncharacterized protein LOC143628655 [Bidens hawaiensis]|uniref:uncharacterized protein LOC143628655 n=1 Tax=Bidens hawaiensis TaxID=980011 RepID=UPI0040497A1F